MNTIQRLTTLSARKIRHYIKMNEIDREKREIERERVRERERERERGREFLHGVQEEEGDRDYRGRATTAIVLDQIDL